MTQTLRAQIGADFFDGKRERQSVSPMDTKLNTLQNERRASAGTQIFLMEITKKDFSRKDRKEFAKNAKKLQRAQMFNGQYKRRT